MQRTSEGRAVRFRRDVYTGYTSMGPKWLLWVGPLALLSGAVGVSGCGEERETSIIETDAAPADAAPQVPPAICGGAADDAPPCNGCPMQTVIPDGWVCIPAGEFTMGGPPGEEGRFPHEGPQHQVTITEPFLMMTTEVTQAQWTAVFANSPSVNRGRDAPCAQCPVENMTWFAAVTYANALSRAEERPECYTLANCQGAPGEGMECGSFDEDVEFAGVACGGYRLATEAEWEYATRAGTVTRFWSGDTEADLARVGWYNGNSHIDGSIQTHPVGQLTANPWGLFDVHGNVWEWVHDWFTDYDAGDQIDPLGPQLGPNGCRRAPLPETSASRCRWRVLRGGYYFNSARSARSASRFSNRPIFGSPDVGFRLVRRPR